MQSIPPDQCSRQGPPAKPLMGQVLGGERLVSRAELRGFISASDMTIWRWVRAKKFPPPVYIGTRRFWKSTDIERWLEGKQQGLEVTNGTS